jgi:hypothetical protein
MSSPLFSTLLPQGVGRVGLDVLMIDRKLRTRRRGGMVPDLEKAVFKLEDGGISEGAVSSFILSSSRFRHGF